MRSPLKRSILLVLSMLAKFPILFELLVVTTLKKCRITVISLNRRALQVRCLKKKHYLKSQRFSYFNGSYHLTEFVFEYLTSDKADVTIVIGDNKAGEGGCTEPLSNQTSKLPTKTFAILGRTFVWHKRVVALSDKSKT